MEEHKSWNGNENKAWLSKAIGLKIRGLPKLDDTMQANYCLVHKTLALKEISLDKAWVTLDKTLVIRIRSIEEHLQALQTKRKFFSLQHNLVGC